MPDDFTRQAESAGAQWVKYCFSNCDIESWNKENRRKLIKVSDYCNSKYNIWVILRRNVLYLNYSKKPHLDQIFHCQSSRYDVIGWIFSTKNKGKLICNSPNDIISGNFDSEKVDQDEVF
jgi:hypothetical protein